MCRTTGTCLTQSSGSAIKMAMLTLLSIHIEIHCCSVCAVLCTRSTAHHPLLCEHDHTASRSAFTVGEKIACRLDLLNLYLKIPLSDFPANWRMISWENMLCGIKMMCAQKHFRRNSCVVSACSRLCLGGNQSTCVRLTGPKLACYTSDCVSLWWPSDSW